MAKIKTAKERIEETRKKLEQQKASAAQKAAAAQQKISTVKSTVSKPKAAGNKPAAAAVSPVPNANLESFKATFRDKLGIKTGYDSRFTPAYFDNNSRYHELTEIIKNPTLAKSASDWADIAEMVSDVQAGINYQSKTGGNTAYTPGNRLYEYNDAANKYVAEGYLNEFLKNASEDDVYKYIDAWKAKADSIADEDSDSKRLTLANIKTLEEYAEKNFASYSHRKMNNATSQMTAINAQLRKLNSSEGQMNLLEQTMSTSYDPVFAIQNSADLRKLVGYDELEKQYAGDEGGLYEAVIMRASDMLSGNTAAETQAKRSSLMAKRDALNEEREKYNQQMNDILTADNYGKLLADAGLIAKGQNANVQPYSYNYDPNGALYLGSIPEYERPSLAQIIADPDGTMKEYDKAVGAGAAAGMDVFADLARHLEPGERDALLGIYENEGDAGLQKAWENYVENELMKRDTEEEIAKAQKLAVDGPLGAIAAAGMTFGTNVLGAVGGFANAMRGEGEIPDQMSAITEAIRNTQAQAIAEKTPGLNIAGVNIPSLLYQGAMSAGDMVTAGAIAGPYAQYLQGGSAFSSQYYDTLERTGDKNLALAEALAAFGLEAGTENISWGALENMGDLSTAAGKLKYLGSNALTNAGEEMLSSAGGYAASALLEGREAEVMQRYQYLVDNGYTTKEAAQMVLGDIAREIGSEGLIGGLVGGGVAGANVGIETINQNAGYRSLGQQIKEQGNVAQVLNAALESNDDGLKKVAQRLMKKLNTTDPNADVLPDDSETNAELSYVAQVVVEEAAKPKKTLQVEENENTGEPTTIVKPRAEAETRPQKQLQVEENENTGEPTTIVKPRTDAGARPQKQLQVNESEITGEPTTITKPLPKTEQQPSKQLRVEQSDASAGEGATVKKELPKTDKEKTDAVVESFKGSTTKLGKLYEGVMKALDVEIRSRSLEDVSAALKARLKQLGETQIDEVTDAIAAIALGKEVTEEQKGLVQAASIRKGVLNDLTAALAYRSNVNNWAANAISQETENTRNKQLELAQATRRRVMMPEASTAPAARAPESASVEPVRVAESGETSITTDAGDVIAADIVRFEGGDSGMQAVVSTESGEKSVPVAQVMASDEGQATLITRAAMIGSAESATAMLENYDGKQDVGRYVNGFEAAYNYASAGVGEEIARKSGMTTDLSEAQLKAAYTAGAAAVPMPTRADTSGGKVSYASGLGDRLNTLTPRQRAGIEAVKRIAEVGAVNIEFFESQADESGSYMGYENGSYDPATNTIYIDVNAGKNYVGDVAEYAMLRTAAHELTHYIRSQNPEGYKSLADYAVEFLTKDGSSTFDELVAAKMNRSADLSYADAVEEVIADGSEMMLKDSTAIQQLAEKNMSLFKRIRRWITNFVRSVKKAFEGVSANSREARLLETATELQKRWDDALVGAMERVKSRQSTEAETSAEESGVKFSRRDGIEFAEDKYFDRIIDKIEERNPDGNIRVGAILEGSVLNQVGLPAAGLYFDVSKINRQLENHNDHISKDVLKRIPEILRDPVVIAQAKQDTISVFGEVTAGDSPVMVGIVVTNDRRGHNLINKVRTIHARRNFADQITDGNTLYLDENKKRTRDWFKARGIIVPLGGTKFGFIRSIADSTPSVKKQSRRIETTSDRELLADAFESVAWSKKEREMLAQYRQGIEELENMQENLQKVQDATLTLQKNRHGYNEKDYAETLGKYQERERMLAGQIEVLNKKVSGMLENELLGNAFAGVAETQAEKEALAKYQQTIDALAAKQERLQKLRDSMVKLQKSKQGMKDADYFEELKKYRDRASLLTGQIDAMDNQIVRLIQGKPLARVLEGLKDTRRMAELQELMTGTAVKEYRLGRERAELRQNIKGFLERFNKQLENPTKSRYIPKNAVKMVIEAAELVNLDRYGWNTKSKASEETKKKAADKINAIRDLYEGYKTDPQFEYVYDENIAAMIDAARQRVGEKSIYQLDNGDLRAIYDMLKATKKAVSEAAYLKAREGEVTIFDAGTRMFRETQEAAPLAKGRLGEYLNWQLTPDKFFDRLAGHKKDSEWSRVARSFMEGTQKMLEVQRDFDYHFREFTDSEEFDRLTKTGEKDLVDIGLKDDQGKSVKITRGMMLSAYMHLSSEDNTRGFMFGGFSVPEMKKYYAGKITEAYGTGSRNTLGTAAEVALLSEKMYADDVSDEEFNKLRNQAKTAQERGEAQMGSMRERIEQMMTPFEKRLIEAVHEWNDGKSRDYINDVTMDMYGIKKAGVKNYYPIHRDPAFVNMDFASISRNMNLENWGSLKDRVASSAPILLTDIVFEMDNSLNQMSRYVGYARAQHDFKKLYNVRMPGMTGSVKKIVGTKFGTGEHMMGASGAQYIENYIGSITGSRRGEGDFLTAIRRNLPRATMTLNPRVGFSQLSAIPKAAAEVGWDSLLKGFFTEGGFRAQFSRQAREELAKQNVWFWTRYRGEGGQREFADMKGGTGPIDRAWSAIDDKTRGWLLNLNQKMDVAATVAMRSMAVAWAKKHTNYAEGSAEFNKAVNDKYTDVLRNTQAANTVSERSDLARGSGGLNSILTMYKSEAFSNFNILYDALAKLRRYRNDLKAGKNGVTKADVRGAWRHFAGAATSVVVVSSMLNAVLKSAVNALTGIMNGYRDEEDELSLESYGNALLKELFSDAAGTVVLGGEIYDIFAAVVLKEHYYAPSDAALEEVFSAAETAINLINKENKTGEDYAKAGEKLAISAANMLGIPMNNLKRTGEGIYRQVRDIVDGGSFDFGGVNRSNSVNYGRLVNASLAGDDEKFDEVYDELASNYQKENGEELTEKEFISGFKGYITKQYRNGKLEKEQATQLLKEHTDIQSADDLFWYFDEKDYGGDDYAKGMYMEDAIASRSSSEIKKTIKFYTDHGYDEDDAISLARSKTKELYAEGRLTWAQALDILLKNLNDSEKDYDDEHVQYWLKREWDFAKANDGSGDGYSKYADFYAAIESGKDASKYADELLTHAETAKKGKSAAMSSISARYKNAYIDAVERGDMTEANRILEMALDAYEAIGVSRSKQLRYIQKNWKEDDE